MKYNCNHDCDALYDAWRKGYKDGYAQCEQWHKEENSRFEWHDIRKNPEDLPEDVRNVLVYTEGDEYAVAYYGQNNDEWAFYNPDVCLDCEYIEGKRCDDVIAWREIEPFKEVE